MSHWWPRHCRPHVAGTAVTREGRDIAVGSDHAHPQIARIRDVNIARRIHRDRLRRVQLRLIGRAAVAREARCAGARERADHTLRSDLPDHVVAGVGHVDVPRRIQRNPARRVELGLQRRAAVA